MNKKYLQIFLIFFVMGCDNILEETAKKDTREAVYYQAKKAMDSKDYDTAITLMLSLGPTFLAQRDVAAVYASAYSGRCGLDFVQLVSDLENVGASPSVLLYLMGIFPNGTDAKITDCVLAEGILKSFGNESARTDDENVLMGLSSLTKVGIVLNRYADSDNDGVADAGFDHCDATDLPDDAVGEIGTGIGLSLLSISAVASDLSSDTFTAITDLCALDPSLNAFCTTTDKNNFTANEIKALRAVIGSTDFGIASCAGAFITCLCP